MSRCIDKRFEKMLHAFEMGMLSEKEFQEFREHLLSCEHCFERARKMETAAELMRIDSDVRVVPGQVLDELSRSEEAVPGEKVSRFRVKFWPTLAPVSVLVAAIIVVFLVLKPWQFEIRPTQEAVAAENRLAILYFKNTTWPGDPQQLGEITASLLIADLSESHYLQVVSSQRLYDILKLLDVDENSITDRETAARVAEKAGAKWMLTGSILQVLPNLVVTAEITEVSSGKLVTSQRVAGEEGEDIFSLVDKLTVQIKNELSLPLAAQQEPDLPVAEVTTHSHLAYRYYLEGVMNYNRYYNSEAVASFKKALAIDSTFAMVYYYLSLTDNPNLIDKAVAYSDRARRKDRYFIRSRQAFLAGDYERAIRELQASLEQYPDDKEAYYRLGLCYAMRLEFDKSIQCYKKAIEIDPLYKVIYNQMAYTYDWMGKFELAIQAIDMYISLAPEEPNPYDSRGDIYTRNGRLEPAIESYARALELKPDFWASLYKYGKNNLLLGRFDIADSCFEVLASCDNRTWRANGLAALAFVPLRRGQFDYAIEILDKGLVAIEKEDDGKAYPLFYLLKTVAYEEKNELQKALKACEASISEYRSQFPDDKTYNRHLLVKLLAQTGQVDSAVKVADEFEKHLTTARDTLRHAFAVGSIALAKGDLTQALTMFEKAAEDTVIPYTPANFTLARVYVETGRWTDAVAEFNKLNRDFTDNNLHFGSLVARAHYYRGVAYEELKQYTAAEEQYRVFLDLWKNADSDLPEIADARERLSELSGKP